MSSRSHLDDGRKDGDPLVRQWRSLTKLPIFFFFRLKPSLELRYSLPLDSWGMETVSFQMAGFLGKSLPLTSFLACPVLAIVATCFFVIVFCAAWVLLSGIFRDNTTILYVWAFLYIIFVLIRVALLGFLVAAYAQFSYRKVRDLSPSFFKSFSLQRHFVSVDLILHPYQILSYGRLDQKRIFLEIMGFIE
jgi:hypothetical protein